MKKAALIIDMPTRCADCPLNAILKTGEPICFTTLKNITNDECYKQKPDWCPLKEIPEKKNETHVVAKPYKDTPWHSSLVTEKDEKAIGFNQCLDEIIGNE